MWDPQAEQETRSRLTCRRMQGLLTKRPNQTGIGLFSGFHGLLTALLQPGRGSAVRAYVPVLLFR